MRLLHWIFLLASSQALALGVTSAPPMASCLWKNSSTLVFRTTEPKYFRSGIQFALVDRNFSSGQILSKNSQHLYPLSATHSNVGGIQLTHHLSIPQITKLLKEPLSFVVLDAQNKILLRTFVQTAPLLDELFTSSKPLGQSWDLKTVTLRLWAPTAKSVTVLLFSDSQAPRARARVPMLEQAGVWSLTLERSFERQFYLFEVNVFSPHSDRVENFLVTDPYSISLSMDSRKSQLVDVDSSDLKPQGWDQLQKPKLDRFNDMVIYESHLRDLTASDPGLSDNLRGTFLGLATPNSLALGHLQKMAVAGLTHLHLLPLMDFATVREDRTTWKTLPLTVPPRPQSPMPQDELDKIKNEDAYNWGYDPLHFFVPDGSYSTDSNGAKRILELRQLVSALNERGLRLILDVVFNHTYASGLFENSIFDRIVPLYYYRLRESGEVYNSSCCADLATENKMVERLMVDATTFLARTYKLDGFRFDLMNLHTLENMHQIKTALGSLTLKHDGVDGKKIFTYGEAWPFGSLEEKSPGEAFFQLRSYGLGIAVFNDRLRDAVRGGTTDSKEKSDQGFATGLFYDFNYEPANRNTPTSLDEQRDKVLHLGDVIKIGLAGNLRDFWVRDHFNNQVRASDLLFRNSPAGYSAEAVESLNYVSAHDGYGLWDAIQAKMPFASSSTDRVRAHRLMLAIVMLAQGIPFFEGGSELLRSKSGDVDSYNSGDWFNAIDFTMQTNGWGKGLPPHWKNINDWSFWQPRLENFDFVTGPTQIQETFEYFLALLRLRQSDSVFRMNSLAEIQTQISYPTDDRTARDTPGLLALSLNSRYFIFFNANSQTQSFVSHATRGRRFCLSPFLDASIDKALSRAGFDPTQGLFLLPPRSTAVFEVCP